MHLGIHPHRGFPFLGQTIKGFRHSCRRHFLSHRVSKYYLGRVACDTKLRGVAYGLYKTCKGRRGLNKPVEYLRKYVGNCAVGGEYVGNQWVELLNSGEQQVTATVQQAPKTQVLMGGSLA